MLERAPAEDSSSESAKSLSRPSGLNANAILREARRQQALREYGRLLEELAESEEPIAVRRGSTLLTGLPALDTALAGTGGLRRGWLVALVGDGADVSAFEDLLYASLTASAWPRGVCRFQGSERRGPADLLAEGSSLARDCAAWLIEAEEGELGLLADAARANDALALARVSRETYEQSPPTIGSNWALSGLDHCDLVIGVEGSERGSRRISLLKNRYGPLAEDELRRRGDDSERPATPAGR